MGGARTKGLIVTLLAVVTATVYWAAAGNDFVFDDREYLLAEKRVLGGLNRESLVWALTSTGVSLYAPIARLSTLLDFHIYGKNPFGHHLTSLLLHGATGIVIFLALAALTGALWKSAAVAALCAVHPLRVEPAAWISARADLLAALFGSLALLAWVQYLRRRSRAWAAIAFAAFLLGMLSKLTVMMLPFALLLLDFWPLGRVGPAARNGSGAAFGPEPGCVRKIAALLGEKAGLFLLTGFLVGVALFVLQRGTTIAVVTAERYPFSARAATSLVSHAVYLGKTLWPSGLAAFYPHRWGAFSGWEVGAATLLLVGAGAGTLLAARRRPYLVVGWCWFLGMLLPVLGFFQAREYPIADRYMYLPQIGLFVLAVWRLEDVGSGLRRGKTLVFAAVLALILACVPLSIAQVRHWKDDYTLFSHALAVTKENWLAHYNVAWILNREGKAQEAAGHYEETIRINPGYVQAYNNLGLIRKQQGRAVEAELLFRRALQIFPGFHEARLNLAGLGRQEPRRGNR